MIDKLEKKLELRRANLLNNKEIKALEKNIERLNEGLKQAIIRYGGSWCNKVAGYGRSEYTQWIKGHRKWKIEKRIEIYKKILKKLT